MLPDFLYFVTVFAPAQERIPTLARDAQGNPALNDAGENYHHVLTYELWLKQEGERFMRQANIPTGIAKNANGEIALYAMKTTPAAPKARRGILRSRG